jgi:hypothetical protein
MATFNYVTLQLLLPIIFFLSRLSLVTSTQMLDLYWNATSSMFRIDNTDHILDVNAGNHPWEYDQVNLVCPVYKPGTEEKLQEQYIIYSVSKQEYDSCRITQANPRIVAVCNQPHNLMYFTITFRSFTPTPGGMEFIPGHDYYFISTSSRTDLHRRVGGACSSKNMKLMFKVAPDLPHEQNIDRDNTIISTHNKKLDSFVKIAKQTKHQQPNPLRADYHRKMLIEESRRKLRDYTRNKDAKSSESHHTVLYYPWREMIQERTGYFSSDEADTTSIDLTDKMRSSKIVQSPRTSSASSMFVFTNLVMIASIISKIFSTCVNT